MPEPRRNNLEYNGWCIRPLTDYISTRSFNCGRDDLNEFFQIDLPDHERYLLTKTYSVTPVDIDESFPIVALISFCNDKIYLESVRDRIDIPEDKRYRYLPAVKIARLGVYKDYRGKGIGSHVINVAKKLFLTNNRTGCRILTVDAYKEDDVISFYQKNYFDFVNSDDPRVPTRTMFYDLIRTDLTNAE